jgi:hypothetical protein
MSPYTLGNGATPHKVTIRRTKAVIIPESAHQGGVEGDSWSTLMRCLQPLSPLLTNWVN